jgi:hypothetical protein
MVIKIIINIFVNNGGIEKLMEMEIKILIEAISKLMIKLTKI